MKFHPDVLAAHAQFGGDLEDMQSHYDTSVPATLIRWAHDTLYEINPDNYDHAEVQKLNDASVEVILGLAQYLGERHGKTDEWWQAYKATHPLPISTPPAGDLGAVKVKPLEWNRKSIDGSMHMANCLLGEYRVWEISGDGYFWREPWVSGQKAGSSMDDAKAAAQSDYTSRILSAISSSPVGEMDGKREVAWLIERNNGEQPWSWYAEKANGWHWWTTTAHEAKRFASNAEAEAFPAYQMIASDPTISITEHVFLGANR